jgi:hypothetical protein
VVKEMDRKTYWQKHIAVKYPRGELSCKTREELDDFNRLFEEYVRLDDSGAFNKMSRKIKIVLGGEKKR